MNQLLAFHNDKKLQKKYVTRVKKHYELDEIVQGIYWENGKGCAVGCIVEKNSDAHQALQDEIGIPFMVGMLADRIFEGLSKGEAKKFPLDFIKAITPGSDLTKVGWKFQIWLLTDKHNGIKQWANKETKKIIDQIVLLQKQLANGEEIDVSAASAASAAESAAESARAARAAWAAAWSARSARAAAWAARSAAASAQYTAMGKKLIQLLKEAA